MSQSYNGNTPEPSYVSLTERAEYRDVFPGVDDSCTLRVGDRFWDSEQRVRYTVEDVVAKVGVGIVRGVETPEEVQADPEYERVLVAVESDHPEHDDWLRIRLSSVDEWLETGRLQPHGANGWLPDKLAR